MKSSEKIIVAVALLLVFSFLGIPVPDWFSSFVSSLAGTIAAIITGFSNLMAFLQFFVRF
ncbi:MAG: hypothetical protein WA139_04485 [Candidatus Aenigmatarchaeota archaeon]